jgi:hypothetical protein
MTWDINISNNQCACRAECILGGFKKCHLITVNDVVAKCSFKDAVVEVARPIQIHNGDFKINDRIRFHV